MEHLVEPSSKPKSRITWRSKIWYRVKSVFCFCKTVCHIEDLEDLREVIRSIIDDTNTPSKKTIYKSVCAFLDQTGLINESLDVLKDELQCPVCQDIPLETNLTECRHILCEYCLSMSLLLDKGRCPLCRTSLPNPHPYNQQLRKIDVIIEAVMLKRNPRYNSWLKQELLERVNTYNTSYLQFLHDTIADCVERLEFYDGDEEVIKELSDLSQRFQLLMKELPCSEANQEKFLKKRQKLCESAARILRPLKLLGFVR